MGLLGAVGVALVVGFVLDVVVVVGEDGALEVAGPSSAGLSQVDSPVIELK